MTIHTLSAFLSITTHGISVETKRLSLIHIYIELVPRVGDHLVYLGKLDNFEDKLARLKEFYKKAFYASRPLPCIRGFLRE